MFPCGWLAYMADCDCDCDCDGEPAGNDEDSDERATCILRRAGGGGRLRRVCASRGGSEGGDGRR